MPTIAGLAGGSGQHAASPCEAWCTEWSCSNSLQCGGCPPCVAVRSGYLTAGYCDAELSNWQSSVFYQLWGAGWERHTVGVRTCWEEEPGGASAFFEAALRGDQCTDNWFTAAQGDLSDRTARVRFTGPAPAVLGFDGDIFGYCSDMVGKSHSYNGEDWQAELAHRCIGANAAG